MNVRVYRNVGWNTVFLLLRSVVSLAAVPLLLRSAGDAGFGIFSFFSAVVAVSVLIQAGLDLAVARSVARYRGNGDREHLRGDLSFAYLFATVAGVVQAAVVLALPHLPGLVEPADRSLATWLSVVFAGSALLNAALVIPMSILVGLERFLLRNSVLAAPPLVGLFVAVLLSRGEPRASAVVVYAVTTEVVRFVGGLVALGRAEVLLKHLASLSRADLWRRDLLRFQGKQMVNQVADYLFYTTDRVILQGVLGAVVVAQYAVADRPNILAQQVVSTPLVAIVPALAAAVAAADHRYVQQAVRTGTRVYCWVTVPVLVVLLAFAPALIEVWVGPGYAAAGTVARWFVVCLLVQAPFKIYSHLRLAEGSIGVMTLSKITYAPFNAVASFVLASHLGLLGVVYPTVVFYTLVYPAVWSTSMIRRGEFPPFLAAVGRPVLTALAFLAGCFAVAALGLSGPLVPGVAVVLVLVGLGVFATAGGGLAAYRSGRQPAPGVVPEPVPAH